MTSKENKQGLFDSLGQLCIRDSQTLRREAGKLDQIALLSRCVRELAEPDTELCMQLAKTDDAGFFPWGVRLAELLEECFTQVLTPEDMLYTEGEVAPFGAALLGSLGKIFRRYRDALIESDLTTPGFDAFVVASALEEGTDGDDLPPLPDFLAGRAILLAGFGMLTGTENTLFRYLWPVSYTHLLRAEGQSRRRFPRAQAPSGAGSPSAPRQPGTEAAA